VIEGKQAAPAQSWDPARYAREAAFVAELGVPLLEWLRPRPGERILDLGCGEGALTAKLARSGAMVVGVDSSPEQVAAARARGLDAREGDAANLAFADEFDAVFSNAALHWVRDQDAVARSVGRVLRPGGRFVVEMGGEGNIAAIIAALRAALARRGIDAATRHPWVFPGVGEARARLERHGFAVERIELFARPTPLPGRLADWLEIFARPFLAGFDDRAGAAIMAEVEEATAASLRDRAGRWSADYVRLRFAATRP
jgi:SAM-dependent methyltransferase